ncbi:ABC transporter substrate-binding protein [Salidesulfovibrio brasiliensis]|uniref:ABC transporter substrate-binding protein n=1 Tax=Salidesulfovibrio brasiliensis TaxID=221711 RepID=UPI0006D0B902|nr:ABC transporter substrate-binding protein [Salidesulfovibrio brasiliensis]
MKKSIVTVALLLILSLFYTMAQAADTMRFGVPPWPGVTVKTAVVTQILDTMGYDTEQYEVGPPIIYKGITTGDVDVCVAAWLPSQNEMYTPVKEKGGFTVAGVNLDEAVIGLAVPSYVYEAGITSMADLDKNADKFDHSMHTIEIGSAMHATTEAMVKEDFAGLGDWELVSSTTPVMLSLVQNKVKKGDWVVFHAWKPHWMTVKIDMKFLDGIPGSEELITKSWVETIVSNDFQQRFPEAFRFLQQFKVTAETQSRWIYEYGYEDIPPATVARKWIATNLDTVKKWLEGVKTVSGEPAFDAIRAAYK